MAIALPQQYQRQVSIASGLDIVAGAWLFLSPWVVLMHANLAWNNWVVGALVAIMAAVRAFGAYTASWISWVNVVLGIWVIAAPWIVADAQFNSAAWNNVVTGLIIVILAAWSAVATNTGQREVTGTTTMRDRPPVR